MPAEIGARVFDAIRYGWLMAEQNSDGSRAGAAQRVYNFATNGGGTITYRALVTLMAGVIVTLLGWMWSDLRGTLGDIQHTQATQGDAISRNTTAVAVHESRLNEMAAGKNIMWQNITTTNVRLDDHERRINALENAQPRWPRSR